jgi:hypothetical protein
MFHVEHCLPAAPMPWPRDAANRYPLAHAPAARLQ